MTEYDHIVVGGGSAGCVLAARLSEEPDVSVLLLEAGPRDRNPLYHMPAGFAKMTKGLGSWGWQTVPQRHLGGRRLNYTQAKVIGGGSSINAQIYTRGHAGDYDAWAAAGCEGWSYREVLPYFRRSEGNERFSNAYHSGTGPLGVSMPRGALPICDAFLRAAQDWGMPYNPDFNGVRQAGCGFYQLTQRDARRSSAARAFLVPAEGRANLTVRTGVAVRRVMVEGRRAVGVETADGPVRAGRGVVLAAGAIGSPWLLMRSGIGPADHLRQRGVAVVHDLPGVGENLQDHLDLCTIAECTGAHTYDGMDRWDRAARAGLQYLLTRTGPVTASLFETGGFWYAEDGAPSPDIQFHLGQGSGIEKGIEALSGHGVTLNSAYLRPRSRGTVRLDADPDAPPLIDPNYWADPHDRAMSLRGLEMAREIMAQPALAPFVRREVLPGAGASEREVMEYAVCAAKTDHHPAGTCRMGVDDAAVVDPALRVRGIEGLRVCDASVMPRVPSSNTNAPTLAVGEKGADLIRGLEPLPAAVVPPN
ncbi:GMC family oxidoreductase [Jannaschia sp. LMIT008]|uniref:GMC family oxidoreductase n=1 Tax=Jannaschia maritima TaxID=3032585 RepID=UPI002812658B|nr:GMC family oxidoreductase N-terminal domain-containing protein [Jannaschia sp. LMIT008]